MPNLDNFKFCAQFEFPSPGRALSSESNTTIQELSSIYPTQTTKHNSKLLKKSKCYKNNFEAHIVTLISL